MKQPSSRGNRVARAAAPAVCLLLALAIHPAGAVSIPVLSHPETTGEWALPVMIPFGPIHAQVLPNGKVLLVRSSTEIGIWNPETSSMDEMISPVPTAFHQELNCSGHMVLNDGRVMFVGGTDISTGAASAGTVYLDPATHAWTLGPQMHTGRWYPTLVATPDHEMLAFAGMPPGEAPLVEKLESDGAWHVLEGAELEMLTYPHSFWLPSGKIVRTGPEPQTMFFDPASSTWSEGPLLESPGVFNSVLMPGLERVLVVAGRRPNLVPSVVTHDATAVHVLDVHGEPTWRRTASMNTNLEDVIGINLVLLPDASILAVGGGIDPNVPELFDTGAETWASMDAGVHSRGHHSVAVLLPDGRVLSSGGDPDGPLANPASVEIFSPPYLFRGPRPSIAAAPSALAYHDAVTVATGNASDIQRVALIGLGANTHAVNFGQRFVNVSFSKSSPTDLLVQTPASANEAPPGWYMLFVVNGAGVPSVAKIVRVG
jgi:hypothetical protein